MPEEQAARVPNQPQWSGADGLIGDLLGIRFSFPSAGCGGMCHSLCGRACHHRAACVPIGQPSCALRAIRLFWLERLKYRCTGGGLDARGDVANDTGSSAEETARQGTSWNSEGEEPDVTVRIDPSSPVQLRPEPSTDPKLPTIFNQVSGPATAWSSTSTSKVPSPLTAFPSLASGSPYKGTFRSF